MEVLTLLRETSARHSSLADKPAQNEQKTQTAAQQQVLPSTATKAPGQCNAAEEPATSLKPQSVQLFTRVFLSQCLPPAAAATLSQVAVPAAPLQAVERPSGKLREVHMLWAVSQMAEVPLISTWLLYGNCRVTSSCLHKALPPLQGAQKSEFSHTLQTKLGTAIKCPPPNPPPRKEGLHCT